MNLTLALSCEERERGGRIDERGSHENGRDTTVRDDAPVQFAAMELARYLERMDEGIHAEVRRELRYAPEKPGIFLGLYEDFGLDCARRHFSGV